MLCMPVAAWAQSYTYDIKTMGVHAGTMVVTRNKANALEQYSYETHSAVDYLLGKVEVNHITRSSYKDGVLQTAYVRNEKNGEVEYYSSTSYDGSDYCTVTEKGKVRCRRKVALSFAKVFFEEPVGQTEIFSERLGEFVPLKQLEEHTYQVCLPDGDKYTYYFEGGRLVRMDVPSPLGKAHFYLRK